MIVVPHEKSWAHCSMNGIHFEKVSPHQPSFEVVLRLRQRVLGRSELLDPVDDYSSHYVAMVNEVAAAALRVTRLTDGQLDCQTFLPQRLLACYESSICSASRFVADPRFPPSLKLAHMLVETAWVDQLLFGTRLDIINVHERAVRYYGKMGYELVRDSCFVHPVFHTPSRVMVYPATASRESPLKHVFEGLESPFPHEHLSEHISVEPWKTFRRTARSMLPSQLLASGRETALLG